MVRIMEKMFDGEVKTAVLRKLSKVQEKMQYSNREN
jgi:hypothetical protein